MLSSANHRVALSDVLHDPNLEQVPCEPWKAYVQSKAASVLLAVGFDSIGQARGVRAFAVHPGGIFDTGLVRHMDLAIAKAFGMIDADGQPIIDPQAGWKTPEQGASTMLWAATSPLLAGKGGVYLRNNEVGVQLAQDEGELDNNGAGPGAKNPSNASRMWRLCEELTGARID